MVAKVSYATFFAVGCIEALLHPSSEIVDIERVDAALDTSLS